MRKLKKITLITSASVCLLAATSSCGKYEDGPGLTLLSKKSRVVGEWDVKSIGSNVLTSEYGINMSFEKNGSMIFSYIYGGSNETYSGSWDFALDKENLLLTVDGEAIIYEIKRLTNKEMWLDDDITSDDGEIWKLEAK